MAVDSKFFNIPFATSGDKATIPEVVQPSGAISYTQGYGPDYERDPATDPLAKRVPRDETNEIYYEITLAIKYLQLYGTPQYTAVADGGPANYPISASVRYDAGAGMQRWRSLVATNTAVPGSDATKWGLDDTVGEATLAQALAGILGGIAISPRRLAAAVQQRPWTAGSDTGTATALVVTLAPALTVYTKFMQLDVQVANNATGAATINVNGLGAKALVDKSGAPIIAGFWQTGDILSIIYDGTSFRVHGGNTPISAGFSTTYSTNQPLSNAVLGQSALNNGSAPFGAVVANGFTFSRPGTYAVSAQVGLFLTVTGATPTATSCLLRLNGGGITGAASGDSDYIPVATSSAFTQYAVGIINVQAGDVVTVFGSAGSNTNFGSASITSVLLTIIPLS